MKKKKNIVETDDFIIFVVNDSIISNAISYVTSNFIGQLKGPGGSMS